MALRQAGICYIKVDGAQLEIEGDVECPISQTEKERLMGLSGVAGYKETALGPYVKVGAIFTGDFPLNAIATGNTMTVTAEFANGLVYTLTSAWLEGDAPAKPVDGKISLEFSGITGVWQ